MTLQFSPEDLCPQCGNFLSSDNPHPHVIFTVCGECGYHREETTLGDEIDQAMDLFKYND